MPDLNRPSKPQRFMLLVALSAGLPLAAGLAHAQTVDLADRPLFSTTQVPGNLALALSVEWPTATTSAYPAGTAYSASNEYLGYFDPERCYRYELNSTTPQASYFTPVEAASNHACSSSASKPLWSGNYLNWSSMQTLDAFRWILTGGFRSVDTPTETVLTKTYSAKTHSSAANKSLSGSSTVTGATPFDEDWTINTRIQNIGTRMWITKDGSLGSPTVTAYNGHNKYVSSGNPLRAQSDAVYEVYVNVKVCDAAATAGPWVDRCVQYANGFKPEGLMQKNTMKLRYSAFGYLNDSVVTRDGGVMRARMKSIGPQTPVPGAPSVTNPNAEWDPTTGVMLINPDSADAAQTASDAAATGNAVTVPNSGVMNYLNKFGFFAQDYKSFDPVGEMYYAVTRYFRNLGNVPEYSSLAGAGSAATMNTWVDAFPVIQTWDDPMQYSCQKNFVIGIGDIFTHRDRNLPGSTISSGDEPALPSAVSSDTTVDVTAANNMIQQLEGSTSLNQCASKTTLGVCTSGRNNSYYMAGLAYDAHTQDIRADLASTQTINTYWLDVLEQPYGSKNQYWLTAKYGGFDVPAGFAPYAATNDTSTLTKGLWSTTGTTVGADDRPDNYFVANSPELLQESLERAFAKIEAENDAATSTAFSTTTARLSVAGTATYTTRFDPKGWTGELAGSSITFDADGNGVLAQKWSAQALLDATDDDDRKIVTRCTPGGSAVPFRSSDLSSCASAATAFANVPGATSQSASNFIDYLRGDRSRELGNGGAYRTRTHLLGDIVGSTSTPVGNPNAPYLDATNPGYSAFKNAFAARKTVVYAGANDGMLHAFDGTLPGATACPTCGTELFAYIPSFVHADLPQLGNPSYTHRTYVDATARAFDVDFKNTPGSSAPSNDWHTLLIGGLGKGGKGYYALDVTDPTAWTSESAVAGKALWEFTDPRMGYTFGQASVVKTKKYGWTVLLSSGYNNSDGRGYLFLVNPRTGALLEAIATPSTETGPINLAHQSAFVPSFADFTADAAYAADLRGNVWRFDLTATSGALPAPTKIATLTDANGAAQPVTTRPLIEIDRASNKRYVVVGTGRLLGDSDISSSQTQSIYAIIDGTAAAGGFYVASTLPSGVTFPVTRSNLNANTSVLTGIGSAPTNPLGWYLDLGASPGGIAERVDVPLAAAGGLVAVGANLPDGSACEPAGTGRVFVMTLAEGRSALVQNGVGVASISFGSSVLNLAIVNEGGGGGSGTSVVVGTGDSDPLKTPLDKNLLIPVKRLNWREVPTAN